MFPELPTATPQRSAAETAYQNIRRAIITNVLPPGQQLKEEWLATHFKTSPTPIREALVKLNQERLVQVIPYRGKFVAPITADEVRQIYEVRQPLEGQAAAQALPHISDDDIGQLTRFFQQAEDRVANGDYDLYFQSDTRLHQMIIKHTPNTWLVSILTLLHDHVHRIRLFSLAHPVGQIQRSLEEHIYILAAMQARDAEATRDRMAAHIQQAGNRIVSMINTLEADAATADATSASEVDP